MFKKFFIPQTLVIYLVGKRKIEKRKNTNNHVFCLVSKKVKNKNSKLLFLSLSSTLNFNFILSSTLLFSHSKHRLDV